MPLAARLLRGFEESAPAPGAGREVEIPPLSPALRAAIAGRIAARDLPGALEGPGATNAPPAAPAGWLDKRKARPTGEGWAPGAAPPARPPRERDQEVATSVLRPEQQAELARSTAAVVVHRIVGVG